MSKLIALQRFGKSFGSLIRAAYRQSVRYKGCKGEDVVDQCKSLHHKGLVLGIYKHPTDPTHPGKLTPAAERYNRLVCGRLMELLTKAGPVPDLGDYRVFYGLEEEFNSVAVVGLGLECQGYDVFEQIDEGKEAIRIAAAVGSKIQQHLKVLKLYLESFGHSESCAEGAALAVWLYQEKKSLEKQKNIPTLELYDDCDLPSAPCGSLCCRVVWTNRLRNIYSVRLNCMHFSSILVLCCCTNIKMNCRQFDQR